MDPLDTGSESQSRVAEPPAGFQAGTALRNSIRELGDQVDSYQAKTAGALGAGVFFLLLALGGAYDVINHNTSISSAIGVTQAVFRWVVIVLGAAGGALMLLGLLRRCRRDRDLENRLGGMEHDLARLESGADRK